MKRKRVKSFQSNEGAFQAERVIEEGLDRGAALLPFFYACTRENGNVLAHEKGAQSDFVPLFGP